MAEFVPVAKLSELAETGKKLLELDDRLLVLVQVGGKYFCVEDVCTHDGGPLGEGRLDGFDLICPRHGARFDVRDGRAKTMPATERTGSYAVKVEGETIYVALAPRDEAELAAAAAVDASSSTVADSAAEAAASQSETIGDGAAKAEGSCGCSGATPGAEGVVGGACGEASSGTIVMGPLTEDRVREELKRVIDPELFVNIIDLGLVYVVDLQPIDPLSTDIANKVNVRIEMTMTSPMCPAGPQLIGQSKQFVGNLPQVNHVEVKLVMDPPWSPDRMSESARDQLGIF